MSNHTSADTVLFVAMPDLAQLTGRHRSRFSQLLAGKSKTGVLLPRADALINGGNIWALHTIAAVLEPAGYEFNPAIVARLQTERTVPSTTIPVGTYEVAEVLAVPRSTVASRAQFKRLTPHLFLIANRRVWSLEALISDALLRGHTVDEQAVERWRARNSAVPPVSPPER